MPEAWKNDSVPSLTPKAVGRSGGGSPYATPQAQPSLSRSSSPRRGAQGPRGTAG